MANPMQLVVRDLIKPILDSPILKYQTSWQVQVDDVGIVKAYTCESLMYNPFVYTRFTHGSQYWKEDDIIVCRTARRY